MAGWAQPASSTLTRMIALPALEPASIPFRRSKSSSVSSLPTSRDILSPYPFILPPLSFILDNDLPPFTQPLFVVDIKDPLRHHAVKLHLEKGLIESAARRAGENLDDLGIFARVSNHRFALFQQGIHGRYLALQLDTLDLAPVVIVLLDGHGYLGIGRQILTVAGVGRGKKIEAEAVAGKEDRRRPWGATLAGSQRHGVMSLHVFQNVAFKLV